MEIAPGGTGGMWESTSVQVAAIAQRLRRWREFQILIGESDLWGKIRDGRDRRRKRGNEE